ncbi:hypothetical protein EYR40_010381 [Pleurotus pulmonarius]|nr:hypothetical protein EYR36_010228 [Pleurotus pulmonarius]KAF4588826.1 hypothetical protein EYR40_010381 [Pleurotus pulmonarius]
MDQLRTLITSPDHNHATFLLPQLELVRPLIQITEKAVPRLSTLGNNESVATTGGAYTNMGILKVIMDHLKSVRDELGYDDDKMYACAAAVAKASSPPSEAPGSLSPRSAAEVFVASIALLHAGSKDVEPFDEVMDPLSMMLVQRAFNTLEDLGMT